MHLRFLQLPPDERRLYMEQAAQQRGLSTIIMEKDFWVCWMLGVLFNSRFADVLVFKGGTSLSKVFGVIDRFSEDIDLSLSPHFLGLSSTDLELPLSRNQADKWMRQAETACVEAVRSQLMPELEIAVSDVLGIAQDHWLEFMIDNATHSPVLLFHYPTTQPGGFDYLKRTVKLEFGSLTDQQPTGRHPVLPWVADQFIKAFDDWRCEVVALELERTFWEKATILHVEHHRPEGKPMPDRFSRHYADTASLALSTHASSAFDLGDLRDRVVNWKQRFFASNWARYDLAKPGTFKLVPAAARVPELQRDYQAMQDMYLSTPIPFDQILDTLEQLENRVNAPTGR